MLKVLKNLKYSFWSVIVIIIFLVIQSQTDLALPEYTSKIVNVGIQSGGIEDAVPEVIGEKELQLIKLLASSEDISQIEDSYIKATENLNKLEIKRAEELLGKDYKEKDAYILKDIDQKERKELSDKMTIPVLGIVAVDNLNIPENISQEQMMQMLEQYKSQTDGMEESIKNQAAIAGVKSIYEKLEVDTDKIQNKYIFETGLQMLGISLITMISAVTVMLFSARVAAKLGKTLREKVFKKVINFSTKELREFSTASLITRSTNDIQQIQQLLAILFRVVVYAPIIAIGGFIKVLTSTDNVLGWIIAVVILATLFVVATLFIIVMPKFKKLQTYVDNLNGVAREILTGLPVIRAFNKEKKEEERFGKANTDLKKANIFVNRAMSLMMPLLILIMNIAMILVIWYGGHSVDEGILQVGDMMAFIQYMMQIVMSFLMISMISIMLPRASVSAKRINEVLETEPNIKDKKEVKKFDETKKGLVEFRNVSFRYPDADAEILEDINFVAEPGKTTAIIGSTGSGKSTVVNLIPRFYDVTSGSILVDGVNIKDVSQKDLRNIIGFVPQKGILFSGTIESNIKYADENLSDEVMEEVASIAQATEFIEDKEKKYKEEIAQGGTNVSGGQKQRLSIARAIAKDPEIYIFDDSFSALDFKTDSKLREALNKKAKDKTVIIVAQRISTILNADQIIVLEEGKIVGKGTHKELIKNNEIYRQIALSQLSEEELGGE